LTDKESLIFNKRKQRLRKTTVIFNTNPVQALMIRIKSIYWTGDSQ
jgi:hypothetical protein